MGKLYILGDIGDYSTNLKDIILKIKKKIKDDDIIIVLGDNFYPCGIKNLKDPLINNFIETFSQIKNKICMILGNHDYLSNPRSQIKNPHWIMPDWYYNFDYGEYSLYFLDTIQLYPSEHVDGTRIKKTHNDYLNNIFQKQLKWLENSLQTSNKKYKLVFGHFPIISNGVYYYDFIKLYNRLMPLFEKYNVKAYFSGHEHNYQYISRKINNYRFNQFICGNSGEVREYEKKHENNINEYDIFYNKTCCYMEVSIINSKLNIYVSDKDKELFKYII